MGLRDWWTRLWGSPPQTSTGDGLHAPGPAADPLAPAILAGTTALSPRLQVHEYHHALATRDGPMAVRTFVTEGIAALNAREVSATVPRIWGDAADGAVLNLFTHLERFAAEGNPAVLGGYTGFRSGDLGGGRPLGVTYARGTAVAGIPVGASTLAAVLLHEEEYRLAEGGFATRVLGRLADRARYFPYPAWWELRDEPVLREREQQRSLVERAGPYVSAGDVRVTRVEGDALVLSLPERAARELAALWGEHPALEALTLSAFVAPDADAQMIWVPGSKEPCATAAGTAAPGRFGHAFVMLVKSGERDEWRMIEDGVGLLLTAPSFDRLRDALVSAKDLTLPLADGPPLRVTFRPEAILDPFSGRAMHAPGGWERHEPKGGPRVDAGRVAVGGITLLLPDAQLAERVDTAALAGFIDAVREAMERAATSHPVTAPTPVAARCTLAPGAPPKVELAWQGAEAPAMLGPLHEALTAMAPVAVRGKVPFQVEVVVHPQPRGEAG